MKIRKKVIAVLLFQLALLIFVFWLMEFFDITSLIFGEKYTPFNWGEAVIESAAILITGCFVYLFYRYLYKTGQEAERRSALIGRQLHEILENIPLTTLIINKEGIVVSSNSTATVNLGMDRNLIEGKNILDLIDPEYKTIAQGKIRQMFMKKAFSISNADWKFRTKKTEPGILTHCLFMTYTDEKTETDIKLIIIAENITNQRELEDYIRQTPGLEEFGRIARGLANNYNNQLMTILGAVALISEKINDSEVLDYIDKIRQTTERAVVLTRNLVDFCRKKDITTIPCNINEFAVKTVNLIKAGLPSSIELVVNSEPRPLLIYCNPALIHNAILNLILNAREAMPDGGKLTISTRREEVKDKVSVTGLEPGLYAAISIKDTGAGIPQEFRDKIFEPFFTTKKDRQGTGLGLSTVYGAAKAHNGSVVLEPDNGTGTKFTIYLPIAAESIEFGPNSPFIPTEKHSEHILLVDDEEILRVVMVRLLEDLGYSVKEASSGQEAVDLYKKKKGKFDGILLDLVMPGMDGFAVIKALKEINPSVKIMVLTGYGMEDQISKLKREGILHYLAKPVGKQELAYHLSRFFSMDNSTH